MEDLDSIKVFKQLFHNFVRSDRRRNASVVTNTIKQSMMYQINLQYNSLL